MIVSVFKMKPSLVFNSHGGRHYMAKFMKYLTSQQSQHKGEDMEKGYGDTRNLESTTSEESIS